MNQESMFSAWGNLPSGMGMGELEQKMIVKLSAVISTGTAKSLFEKQFIPKHNCKAPRFRFQHDSSHRQ